MNQNCRPVGLQQDTHSAWPSDKVGCGVHTHDTQCGV